MASKKKKSPVVDRQMLSGLADRIYDRKTRKFLRMCDGNLQESKNGNTMHCGLGELYFAVTGNEPNEDRVYNVEDAIEVVIKNSPFAFITRDALDEKVNAIRSKVNDSFAQVFNDSNVSQVAINELKRALNNRFDSFEPEQLLDSDERELHFQAMRFREIIEEIPDVNDSCKLGKSSYDEYRNRARAVATKLREAAKLLPE